MGPDHSTSPAATLPAGRLVTVILHYGKTAITRRLHEQLLASDPGLDVRVLDNAAPEPYPGAWLRLPENRYWAGALDFCAQQVRGEGASHLWFMNNDIYFLSKPPHLGRAWNRLGLLRQRLGRIGICSPAVDKDPYHPQMLAAPGLQYRSVRLLDGIAPIFNLDCLEDIGGVDLESNPFGYGVDLVLSLRAVERGWSLLVDQQVVVRHVHHSTARAVPGFMEQAARAEAVYLAARLGPGYRERIEALKAESRDYASL